MVVVLEGKGRSKDDTVQYRSGKDQEVGGTEVAAVAKAGGCMLVEKRCGWQEEAQVELYVTVVCARVCFGANTLMGGGPWLGHVVGQGQ